MPSAINTESGIVWLVVGFVFGVGFHLAGWLVGRIANRPAK